MSKAGYALDMKNTGFGVIPLAYHATAVYADPVTDNLYLVLDDDSEPTDAMLPLPTSAPTPDGITIYQFNSNVGSMVYRWTSKLYLLPKPTSFMWAKVEADTYLNTVLRFYSQVLVAGEWMDILIRELVVASNEVFRFPVGEDYLRTWWEVLSTDRIQTVQISEDVSELN